MFTSRAEYRILLRQDNADLRLTALGHSIGMIDDERMEKLNRKIEDIKSVIRILTKVGITPAEANNILAAYNSSPIKQQVKAVELLIRPHIHIDDICRMSAEINEKLSSFSREVIEQAEIQLKYDGYINREQEVANKLNRLEDVVIPEGIDYKDLKSLSSEAVNKLTSISPKTIGQASRISGISPSDVNVLLIYLGR